MKNNAYIVISVSVETAVVFQVYFQQMIFCALRMMIYIIEIR